MEAIERIQAARVAVDQRKAAVARIEAQEAALVQQITDLKAEMMNDGLDPARLDSQIAVAESELAEALNALELGLNGKAAG